MVASERRANRSALGGGQAQDAQEVVILTAMFVHQTSGRLAARAMGAAQLVEHATTEPERASALQLVEVVRRAGIVAEPVAVHVEGARLTDDKFLKVGDSVAWQALLLAGMAPCFGFDSPGSPFAQDGAGAWRVWFVGPPAAVWKLRVAYALASFHVALAVAGMTIARSLGALAVTLGLVGALAQESKVRIPRTALMRWEGREAPPEQGDKAEGEATKQLRGFGGVAGILFAEQIHAGIRVAGTLRHFL